MKFKKGDKIRVFGGSMLNFLTEEAVVLEATSRIVRYKGIEDSGRKGDTNGCAVDDCELLTTKKSKSMKTNFKVGDRVALLKYYEGSHDALHPIWGENGNYFAGTVEEKNSSGSLNIRWDNSGNTYWFNPSEANVKIVFLEEAQGKIKKGWLGGDKFKLKTDELDALVLGAEDKTEIVAVLKQAQNATKIFEEWGLGEVIEYGRGMTMLFHGEPGTGKTWGANCIAKALNTELLTISSANIQTSEPGGANRNIQDAFRSATKDNKVLLLDECDSLITKREEVGMILGSEINTLLTEIEKFEGVCILATNRIDTLDAALERRISLILEFPKPNRDAREAIWKKMLPKKMPVSKDITPKSLSKHILTGGQIKNAVLQAARFAVAEEKKEVSAPYFTKAIDRINKSSSLMGKKRGRQRAMIDGQMGVGTGVEKDVEVDVDVDIDVEKVRGVEKKPSDEITAY